MNFLLSNFCTFFTNHIFVLLVISERNYIYHFWDFTILLSLAVSHIICWRILMTFCLIANIKLHCHQNQMTTQLFQIFWPEYPILFEKPSPNDKSYSQTFLPHMFLLKLWNSNLKLTLGKMLQKLLSFWVTVQQPYSGKDSYRYEQNTPHWFLQIWTQ